MYNIIAIGFFSCVPIEYIPQNNIRMALLCYFALDSYKNKMDVILHHGLYAFLTVYSPFYIIHRCLIMEWSTLCLLLYKEKLYNMFAFLWFAIRLIYMPYFFYQINNEENIVLSNAGVLIHGFHFHWTCKIVDRKLDTSYGFSSLLLMLIPLNLCIIDFQHYLILYLQSQISFYFNVIRIPYYDTKQYHIIRSLDNSMIAYFGLRYIMFPYPHWTSACLCMYKFFIDYYNSLHKSIFVYSTLCLLYRYSLLCPVTLIGAYIFQYKMNTLYHPMLYKYIWHSCSALLLGYSLT